MSSQCSLSKDGVIPHLMFGLFHIRRNTPSAPSRRRCSATLHVHDELKKGQKEGEEGEGGEGVVAAGHGDVAAEPLG